MTFAMASKIRVLLIGRMFLWFISSVAKLCRELQILFGSNMKYSDFIHSKYFLPKLALKRTLVFEENHV